MSEPRPDAETCPYVSRGGLKLRHALAAFNLNPSGLTCADLGCSTGGFTDCLLQAGATTVHAVDTAYGQFAWKLRKDPRVLLRERTNALHAPPPKDGVDLVVVDLGWTPQSKLLPVARSWLRPAGRIISLIKPHYEAAGVGIALPKGGILDDAIGAEITRRVLEALPSMGVKLLAHTPSPIRGGARGSSKAHGGGNLESLVFLEPI
jgi:23S rRNA (cytidine1920-2'-O)/16S rRNA (cytidine1409-2'-O)-methyltransferase